MTTTAPNVVFMLADNVGVGDLSCYGGSVATPRLDRLTAEGTVERPAGLQLIGELVDARRREKRREPVEVGHDAVADLTGGGLAWPTRTRYAASHIEFFSLRSGVMAA